MRKNIYIPDSMQGVVDSFERAGGNFSEVCQKALTEWVETDSALRGGMGKIEVLVRTGLRDVIQVFTGRYLAKDFEAKFGTLDVGRNQVVATDGFVSVFLTAKGKIAIYKRKSLEEGGTLDVRDSIEDAQSKENGNGFGWDIKNALVWAAKKLPPEKQVLDI